MRNFCNVSNMRWLVYVLIGVAFGVADYYIETTARQFLTYPLLLFVGGVWIIPSSLVAFYEVKRSGSKLHTIVASTLVWMAGVVAYYVHYAIMLTLDNEVVAFSWGDILFDAAFWGVAAAVGGAVVGFLTATLHKVLSKKKISPKDKA